MRRKFTAKITKNPESRETAFGIFLYGFEITDLSALILDIHL